MDGMYTSPDSCQLLYRVLATMNTIESAFAADVQFVVHRFQADFVLVGHVAWNGEMLLHLTVPAEGVDVALHGGYKHRAIVDHQHVADECAVTAVLRKGVGLRVVDEESLSQRAYPYLSVLTTHDALHGGTDGHPVAGLLVEAAEAVRAAMVHVDTKGTAEPDVLLVLIECGDGVVLEAGIVFHHVAVDDVLRTVEAVQAVVGP